MKSNVEGTRNLLNLCIDSRVKEFHYVSSAYACGLVDRSTPVLEKLHAKTGPFGNIYEESKCLAEHLVVESPGDFTRTIFRPSIIVGESSTGYSPSFNAIYTPLRLAWMMLNESPSLISSEDDLLEQMGLQGSEPRNIVPVDWVSQALGLIVRSPNCHGGVFHLTNPSQTGGQEIVAGMVQAIAAHRNLKTVPQPIAKMANGLTGKMDFSAFRLHMESYQSYFQPDPVFDNSRLQETGICPPCPQMDRTILTKVFEYAIRTQFQDAEVCEKSRPTYEPRRSLEKLMNGHSAQVFETERTSNPGFQGRAEVTQIQEISRQVPEGNKSNVQGFRLKLSGPGGGCWWVSIENCGAKCRLPDSGQEDVLQVYGSSAAFRGWCEGEYSFQDGLRAGMFVVTGPAIQQTCAAQLMIDLRSSFRMASDVVSNQFASDRDLVPQSALRSGTVL